MNYFKHESAYIDEGCTIGDDTKIWHFSHIMSGCKIGNGCNIGQNVINPRSEVNRRDEFMTTIIRRGASVGANATIVCGNEIGEYALIGAGAVITKPVAPYALVVGNPAHRIGWVSRYGHRLHFDKEGIAVCPETNERYRLSNGNVILIEQ